MGKTDNENDMKLSCLSDDEKAEGDELDDEINLSIRRKEVLNTVLEKMIDKIKQPLKPESLGERNINKSQNSYSIKR